MTPHPFVTAFKPRPHTVAAEDPSGIEAAQGLDMALWTGKMSKTIGTVSANGIDDPNVQGGLGRDSDSGKNRPESTPTPHQQQQQHH